MGEDRIQFGYTIFVNSVGYMLMTNYTRDFQRRFPAFFSPDDVPYDHYNVAFRFTDYRDDVLIVGAGAGNDVAGALRNGAKRVTAVEIDPEIINLGRRLHPEQPYQNPKVDIFVDDARSFFKKTSKKFDLIIFGLLDSHTLSSSFSNVRLDNYVYTLESFKEARSLLKPNGIVVLIFEVKDDHIARSMVSNLRIAFDQAPIGFEVRSGVRGWGGTIHVVGNQEVIAAKVESDSRLAALLDNYKKRFADASLQNDSLVTDDWPYLYLPKRRIPNLYFVVYGILAIMLYMGISKATGGLARVDWHFFFLGAGFLLLEVQNISKLILLFGATWTVNTFCISSILLMILLANLITSKIRIRNIWIYYAGLFVALGINYFLPLTIFTGMPLLAKALSAGVILTLPFLFSGIIFANSFAKVYDRNQAFAANLYGAMIGGMMECLSFVFGIKLLLIASALLYLLAGKTAKTSLFSKN